MSIIFSANAQFSISSHDYEPEIDTSPRFWQDPTGTVYEEIELIRFNKIGLWSYFRQNQADGSQVIISDRYVYCLENLEQRSSESKKEETRLYPNPVNTNLNIIHSKPMTELEVRNLNGQLIQKYNLSSKYIASINVSTYHQGVYLLTIISNQEVLSKFFVVN